MERGTILVVDDEHNIADLVDLYLSREGVRRFPIRHVEVLLDTGDDLVDEPMPIALPLERPQGRCAE